MNNSYRIRTDIGKDKELKVNLEQDYEFLEILSLKIRQDELYLRNCSDYGVIVGRVFANNGFGIPNAKINVFIPLTNQDATNPIISTLYPYRNLETLNEDGYRYNLLPYVPSYSGHSATGTFPNRKDVLTNNVVADIYEKYYKYTVRTNESGDFMIFGAPVGNHKLFMDLDLSDIGEFSLTPQDLIRMGRGTKEQFDGVKFKRSSNLESLPQIVSLVKEVYVSPLWGENEVCQIGITRQDFDLTTDASIEIRPTSVFMGSMFSTTQKNRLKRTCKVKNSSGDLCSLITGPGEIVAIRQTIFSDENDLPVLEQADLPENGKLIDENGSWLFEVPMNMDFVTTNEFGEQIISDDPSVGIPTTGKYRFKIKWAQSKNINEEYRRAYFLVPNLREYGNGQNQDTQNSYAFDLDWSGYTIQSDPNAIQDFIDCKDKFYKFEYNKVYTVASFIDNFKKQKGKNKFLAIKEISDPRCDSENVKFPTNDGVLNPNFLNFVFNLLLLITTPLVFQIIIVFNILAIIWPLMKFYGNILGGIVLTLIWAVCQAINVFRRRGRKLTCPKISFNIFKKNPFRNLKLPMISYPDCAVCDDTESDPIEEPTDETLNIPQLRQTGGGLLPSLGISDTYAANYNFNNETKVWGSGNDNEFTQQAVSRLLAGASELNCKQGGQKSQEIETLEPFGRVFTYNLPLAEKFNLLNTRDMYYRGFTNVKVSIEPLLNTGNVGPKFHEDNLMVLMLEENNLTNFQTGQLITFVDREFSKDLNVTGASYLNSAGTTSITGATITIPSALTITYSNRLNRYSASTVTYNLPTTGKVVSDIYTFPSDIEYFQVVTGMTVAQFMSLSNTGSTINRRQGLNGILRGLNYKIFNTDGNQNLNLTPFINLRFGYPEGFDKTSTSYNFADISGLKYFPWSTLVNFESKNLIFLQRGVDPKSPRYKTEFDISTFFDQPSGTTKINGDYKINVPIQPQVSGKMPCAQMLSGRFTNNNQVDLSSGQYSFFKSHFYQPATSNDFSAFTTNAVRFYSHLDIDNSGYTVGQICFCQDINTTPIGLSSITSISSNTLHSKPVSRDIIEYSSFNFNAICYDPNLRVINNIDDYSFEVLTYNSFSNPGDWIYYNAGPTIPNSNISGIQINQPFLAQLDGGSYVFQRFFSDINPTRVNVETFPVYMSPIYPTGNTITITTATTKSDTRLVLRSDRLPSSSNYLIDNNNIIFEDQGNNKYLWQQNMNLSVFLINDDGADTIIGYSNNDPLSLGDDIEYEQQELTNLLSSFNCKNMVGLKCYEIDDKGNATINCNKNENYVDNGAYVFIQKPILGIVRDFQNLAEWITRMRTTFALCQGVLSEVFNNNWVNGALFMYPFQQTLLYNNQNKVSNTKHCKDLIIRHEKSNNFYYRSTPYNNNKFTPKDIFGFGVTPTEGRNATNIMHPTTITNLGPKSPLLQFSSTSGKFLGYYVGSLPQTSYSDNSELINLFAISRMLSSKFLGQLFGTGKGSIRSLFSRNGNKVDGDYAQLSSINSQYGIVKFDEDDYTVNVGNTFNQPVRIFSGKNQDPLIAVFFSAETYNLQETDYVSPGRIIFRSLNPSPACPDVKLDYGYKSQLTPHYKWRIVQSQNNNPQRKTIFGSQLNNWVTSQNDIEEVEYQKMDRYYDYYFKRSQSGPGNDIMERNYIWSVDDSGNYQEESFPGMKSNIVVGAPNYFYFGLKNGKTSIDRYFKDYLNIELND